MFFCVQANAIESLSYSGRLVQTNGTPVTGTVNLRAELAYTNALSTILCSDDITGVVLAKGVFHIKLDFACTSGKTLSQVLSQTPVNESVAIQITDVTNSKSYSFQAIHAVPYSNVSSVAVQLDQNGAADGDFLKWDNTAKKWKPDGVSGANGGTVTDVTANLPLSVTNGTTTPDISIAQANTTTSGYLSAADWNTFNNKQAALPAGGSSAHFLRGDNTWQTLNTDSVPEGTKLYFTNALALGVPLTGFSTATGSVVATDTILAAIGKLQGQINLKSDAAGFVDWSVAGVQTIDPSRLNLGAGNASKAVVTDASGFFVTGGASSTEVGYLNGVTSNIQTQLNSKQATITSATNVTTGTITAGEVRLNELPANGTEYTGFKSPSALATNVIYTLPLADGSSGQVLTTNSTGGLSWTTVATGSTNLAGDISGTIGSNTIGAGKVTLTHLSATGTKDNTTYLRGDNTFATLAADVRASVLTGLSTSTNAVVTATDSVLSSLGKLQKQISDFAISSVGGDLSGNLPNPTVAKIQGRAVSSSAPSPGQVLRFNTGGTSWDPTFLLIGDLKSSVSGNLFPGTGCAVNQTLQYVVGTDSFTCVNIDSLDAGKITTGTIAAARLPSSATYWQAATGGINYGSGNVGIGTGSPASPLHIVGSTSNDQLFLAQNTNANGISSFVAKDDTGTRYLTFGVNNSTMSMGASYGLASEGLFRASTSATGLALSVVTGPTRFIQTGSGTERMRIDTGGNVGIGTSSPVSKLEVKDGYVQVSRTETTNQPNFFNAFNSESNSLALRYTEDAIGSIPADVWQFRLGNNAKDIAFSSYDTTPNLMMKAGGNVGIGTAAPSEKLEVAGKVKLTNGFSAANAAITYTSDTGYLYLGPQSGTSTNGAGITLAGPTNADSTGAGPGGITFVTPGVSPAMVIRSDGKVGIYNGSPGFRLDVTGLSAFGGHSGNLDPVGAPNLTTLQNSGKMLVGWNRIAGNGEVDLIANRAGGHTGGFSFYDYTNAGALNNLVNFLGNGNVGIGVTAPGNKLEVAGNILANSGGHIGTNLFNGSFTNSTARAFLASSGYIWSTMESGGGSSNLYLHRHDTSNYLIQFGYGSSFIGSVSTNGSSVSYNTTSDYRLKENVHPMDDALKRVLLIQPKRFNYISTPNQTVDGFIAHELAKVIPEAVTGKKDGVDKEGKILPQLVDYSKVIPVVTGAVKELYKKLLGHDEQLAIQSRAIASKADKAEIESLKVQNKKLQQENDAIKAYLCNKDPKAVICK